MGNTSGANVSNANDLLVDDDLFLSRKVATVVEHSDCSTVNAKEGEDLVVVTPEKKAKTSSGEFRNRIALAVAKRSDDGLSMKSETGPSITLKASHFIKTAVGVKAFLTLMMVDGRGNNIWCYRTDVFGLLYCVVGEDLYSDIADTTIYFEYHKRSSETPNEIELNCLDKKLKKALSPEKHGSKILAYHVQAVNDEALVEKINGIARVIELINHDNNLKSMWMPELLSSDAVGVSEKQKEKIMNDAKFWNLLKTTVKVEYNTALDTYMTYNSLSSALKTFIYDNGDKKVEDWGQDEITAAFSGQVVPKDFK